MNVMKMHICCRTRNAKPERGFTLMELIIATTIMSILTMMVLPMARLTIQRQKEKELRHALWQMRDAIDTYKQASERGAFQIKADSGGYPPDLETLVKGVEAGDEFAQFCARRIVFIDKAPVYHPHPHSCLEFIRLSIYS